MKKTLARWAALALTLALTLALAPAVLAGEEASPAPATDDESLAKQSQNPIANLVSVPIQSSLNFGVGPGDDPQYINLIQPVIPQKLTKDWNWIHRGIIPVPVYQPSRGGRWGLGDIQYEGFLSPAKPGALVWGIGPYLNFPTATNEVLGTGKWSAGPAVVALTMPGDWVIGCLFTQLWSFAGDPDRRDVNFSAFQYFINYNIPNMGGWYLSSSPTMTYDWNTSSGNQWVVPVGGGIGRVFKIGSQPVNARLQAFYYVAAPNSGPTWGLQFQFTFLFPQ